MTKATNTTEIYQAVVAEIQQALQTDRVVICGVRTGLDAEFRVKATATGAALNPVPLEQGYEFSELELAAYQQGQIQVITDLAAYQQDQVPIISDVAIAQVKVQQQQQLQTWSVQAQLGAPILVGGELVGILLAHQCTTARNWQQAEIDFFTQVATQIGLAQDRANLLQQQKAEKERLEQRALELLMQVEPISQGDLTVRATVTTDTIGTVADSYNATIKSLRQLVTQVQVAATQMTQTTGENEQFVQSLATEATQQATGITTALGQIQSMTEAMQAINQHAEQADIAIAQAATTVTAGEQAINRTVEGILAVSETVADTTKKVQSLGVASTQISQVVNLLSEFAAQTHLLALKASIEAARAGESGQGFAVIAEEVRSLAEQSAEATTTIEPLISTIQSATTEVVSAMEVGNQQVIQGTHLVEETRQSLDHITAISTQINQLVTTITQATTHQAQVSKAVTQTMAKIATVSDQTSIDATQASVSLKELLNVAQALQTSVQQFKVS